MCKLFLFIASLLFHVDLLLYIHSTLVVNHTVIDSQVEFSLVTRFVNVVGNIEIHAADILSFEAALLLKIDPSVENWNGGYREGWREYDFLAGPQHALAISIDNKSGVNWNKMSSKLVYEPAMLWAIAYLYASWHSNLI